jgi:two-component system sensor histidine kinase PilS (NtrC family)
MREREPIREKLKALIALRVFIVTVLLGSFFLFKIGLAVYPARDSIFHLITALYALSIVYILLLNRIKPVVMANIQLVLDVFSAISLIYLTGGIESWFSFLLILVVIGGGIVINRRAGLILASLSSILYGMLMEYQFYHIAGLPFSDGLTEKDFIYNIFSNVLALFVSAYLTGHIASRLEKTTKRLEKKVLDFNELAVFNKEVVENVPSGLVTTDLEGKVIFFNRAAEAITGKSRMEAMGESINGILPFLGNLDQVSARAEGTIYAGNEKRVIGITITKMRNGEGAYIGFIGVFQDLTQIKRMQDEMRRKEKWAAIGELSANIAHEIRNPLASLRGSIEMLKNARLSVPQKESLMQIALSEMDRLNRIITDFLTYSRPTRPEPQGIELNQLLRGTCDLLAKSVPEKITIEKNLAGNILITADPQRLQQVFLNLALNAFDAMPDGGRLTISSARNGRFTEINFADTGPGILPENREKIFFPFFTTKDTGTGLGLSIAMRIVEDHGGTIRVKTGPEGSTFSVLLPLEGISSEAA